MSESGAWSYYTLLAKVPNVRHLDAALNALGAEGWELVTSMSTVKSMINITGNDLVLLFKKPGAGHEPSPTALGFVAPGSDGNAW